MMFSCIDFRDASLSYYMCLFILPVFGIINRSTVAFNKGKNIGGKNQEFTLCSLLFQMVTFVT